jgi:hypothetical protein
MNNTPRQQRRRAKLQEIVASFPGGQTGLAARIGTPKTHLSAILAGRRGIGDMLAEKLARAAEMPIDWMDEPASAMPVSEEERAFVLSARKLQAGTLRVVHEKPTEPHHAPTEFAPKAEKRKQQPSGKKNGGNKDHGPQRS